MLDKSKLEELFRLNYSKMVHLARVLLPDSEEAEDVVQDIFVRVADADLPPQSDAYLMIAVRHNEFSVFILIISISDVSQLFVAYNSLDRHCAVGINNAGFRG